MKLTISLAVAALLLLLANCWTCAEGTTIISIKYPSHSSSSFERAQPAKRDLSLSYAATNIDSKEGTRVKTITVIKNVGTGIGIGGEPRKQHKLAINPELHKNEEWATAFRDNFEAYGALPDVPDIDDLFEFVNRKKPSAISNASGKDKAKANSGAAAPSGVEQKESEKQPQPTAESTTKAATSSLAMEAAAPTAATATATAVRELSGDDGVEGPVEKIKGDAELLPHIKESNILRLQALQQSLAKNASQRGAAAVAEAQSRRLRTRESLINVNYSTPMHTVMQYYDNYVQALPNGYDYSKPCAYPPPGGSIQVTTPSGRQYDIPQSNSSGTGGGNHPYLAPSLAKKTQVQPAQPSPQSPNYNSVNSIVPPILQQPGGNFPQPSAPPPPNNSILPPLQAPQQQQPSIPAQQQPPQGTGAGISTSQRPYVAPSLRNNGLGINRGPPPTPLPLLPAPLLPALAGYPNGPSYRSNIFGGGANRPNTFRSRGLKY